jgi:hypothetical protein
LATGAATQFVIRTGMLIFSTRAAENQRKTHLRAIEENDGKFPWWHKTIV